MANDWTSHLYTAYIITEEEYIWTYSDYMTKKIYMNHMHTYHTATPAKKFKVHHLSQYNCFNMNTLLHLWVHTEILANLHDKI